VSGIAGIYHRNNYPVDSDNLRRMVDILSHREPDGYGCWIQENLGFGHRLLWTTPESLLEKRRC
jgi:asparagine synthase (glutamine-hydrolysing)